MNRHYFQNLYWGVLMSIPFCYVINHKMKLSLWLIHSHSEISADRNEGER
ncbi:hypothetical protein [Halalkalibacter flavus]